MAHYAKVNPEGVVEQVIVAEAEFFDTFVDATPGQWIQTSFNTYGGKHYTEGEDGVRIESADQSKALRKNFAAIGGTYDAENDAFIYPKPYDSWVLGDDYLWKPPVDYPDDGSDYTWDEDTTSWVSVDGDS